MTQPGQSTEAERQLQREHYRQLQNYTEGMHTTLLMPIISYCCLSYLHRIVEFEHLNFVDYSDFRPFAYFEVPRPCILVLCKVLIKDVVCLNIMFYKHFIVSLVPRPLFSATTNENGQGTRLFYSIKI